MNPRPARLFAGAIIAALALAAPARAEVLNISGNLSTSGPGYFTGTLGVQNVSTTQAVITVSLTNTGPLANGGYITGFAFNDPNSPSKGDITNVTGFTQTYNPPGQPPANQMQLIGGANYTNTISGSPYGSFDIGAATGGDFLGSGTPQPGIEVGQTGTFTFTVTGTGLDKLTAANILSTMSSGQSGAAAMLVRFRGFTNGDSDKVVVGKPGLPPPPPPPPGVPAPPSLVLAGLALGCGAFGRTFRRRKEIN